MAALNDEPRNPFFAKLAALEAGQGETQVQLAAVADALQHPVALADALGGVAGAVARAGRDQAEALNAQAEVLNAQAKILTRLAESSHRQVEVLEAHLEPKHDAPSAWLYAAGVDRDGTFNKASLAGEFLRRICAGSDGQPADGLRALVGRGGRRGISRKAFVERAMDPNNDRRGLPPDLTEYDLGRFHDLAARVLHIAEANPTPPPPEDNP